MGQQGLRKEITLALQNGPVWSVLTETLPTGLVHPPCPTIGRIVWLLTLPTPVDLSKIRGHLCDILWVVTNAGTQESFLGTPEPAPYTLTGHGGEPFFSTYPRVQF